MGLPHSASTGVAPIRFLMARAYCLICSHGPGGPVMLMGRRSK